MTTAIVFGAGVITHLLPLPSSAGKERHDHIEPSDFFKRVFRHDAEYNVRERGREYVVE